MLLSLETCSLCISYQDTPKFYIEMRLNSSVGQLRRHLITERFGGQDIRLFTNGKELSVDSVKLHTILTNDGQHFLVMPIKETPVKSEQTVPDRMLVDADSFLVTISQPEYFSKIFSLLDLPEAQGSEV